MPLTTVRTDGLTIGAMRSGAPRPLARDSTIRRRCASATTVTSYVANRGNENNFGMRVNRIKLGGPGEEELLSEFFTYGRRGRTLDLAVRRRGRRATTKCTCRTNGTTRSRCSTAMASSCASGARPAAATANCCGRPAWCARRTATSSSSTAATIVCRSSPRTGSSSAKCGKAGSGDGEFNQPWGITLDKDWQYLRRGLEEPSHPEACPPRASS